jgi:creatinine amidohydrolase
VGEAHLATAEKGRITCAHMVAGFVRLLYQVRDLSPDGYAPITGP